MKHLVGMGLAFIVAFVGMEISESYISGFFSGMVYCFLAEMYKIISKERNWE